MSLKWENPQSKTAILILEGDRQPTVNAFSSSQGGLPMSPIRYGVFQLGQIWTLTDERGARLGFPSRQIALAAVSAMVAIHQGALETVLVTIQDERGSLRTLVNPLDAEMLEVA